MAMHIPLKYRIFKIGPAICLFALIFGLYLGYVLTFTLPLMQNTYQRDFMVFYPDSRPIGIIYTSISGVFLFL